MRHFSKHCCSAQMPCRFLSWVIWSQIQQHKQAGEQALGFSQLSRTVSDQAGRLLAWLCKRQDQNRSSAQPKDNTTRCLRLLPGEGKVVADLFQGCIITNGQAAQAKQISRHGSCDSQRFSPYFFPEEQLPKAHPSDPTQTKDSKTSHHLPKKRNVKSPQPPAGAGAWN